MQAAGLALPAVLFARTMVGLGEGVALPSMNNLVATHIQRERKATALGGAFTGERRAAARDVEVGEVVEWIKDR